MTYVRTYMHSYVYNDMCICFTGKAVDMSFDHKPTDKVELDRITNAGGHVGADSRVNGGLNLSRAIGMKMIPCHFYCDME